MWLEEEIVSNHDLVTLWHASPDDFCLPAQMRKQHTHTNTHIRPRPPGQKFSKLFRNGQKLETIFTWDLNYRHFGCLLCDPRDPTTPKRTCTFTTQWNNYATLPVSGYWGKCISGTMLISEEYVSRSHLFVGKKSTSDHSGVYVMWWYFLS